MASSCDLTPYICYLLKALGVGPRELCLEESQKTNLSHIWICDVRARAHITPPPPLPASPLSLSSVPMSYRKLKTAPPQHRTSKHGLQIGERNEFSNEHSILSPR